MRDQNPRAASTYDTIIVGLGPCGLILAERLHAAGHSILLVDQEANSGRKLFIAGSSGLNITHDAPDLFRYYRSSRPEWMRAALGDHPQQEWLAYLHTTLNIETFLGTSRRYFLKSMTAVELLRKLRSRLKDVPFRRRQKCVELLLHPPRVVLSGGECLTAKHIVLCMGGASYLREPVQWPELLLPHDVAVSSFGPSNVAYHVEWHPEFLRRHEGHPLKGVALSTALGSMRGDLVVTKNGLEGTPVYTNGCTGVAHLDFFPDLSAVQLRGMLQGTKENLSAMRRLQRLTKLSDTALDLLYFHASLAADPQALSEQLKSLPILLGEPRPMTEAISSRGGLKLEEMTETFAIQKMPGFFAIGEMLDWDAPTGGFLIQACASMALRLAAHLV